MKKEFKEKSIAAWERIIKKIFPNDIPEEYQWTNKSEIIVVLNIIGDEKNMNHMFVPPVGGLDLDGAVSSIEEACIDLMTGNVHNMINIKSLTFYSFGEKIEWAYFRIETNEIDETGIYNFSGENYDRQNEEVGVLPNGNYITRSDWDNAEYYDEDSDENIEIPSDAYLMVRYRNGSFVIFAKGSIYNENSATYDGRHNKMTAEQFKNYIKSIIEHLQKK